MRRRWQPLRVAWSALIEGDLKSIAGVHAFWAWGTNRLEKGATSSPYIRFLPNLTLSRYRWRRCFARTQPFSIQLMASWERQDAWLEGLVLY